MDNLFILIATYLIGFIIGILATIVVKKKEDRFKHDKISRLFLRRIGVLEILIKKFGLQEDIHKVLLESSRNERETKFTELLNDSFSEQLEDLKEL